MKKVICLLLTALLFLPCCAQADVVESLMILVNKDNALPKDYEPGDLIRPNVAYASGVPNSRKQLRAEAAHALERLFAAAKNDGIELLAVSGYRSYQTQRDIYQRRLAEAGQKHVSLYVAEPGHSEHQTGLAMDLGVQGYTDLTERFAETEAYAWLIGHAHEYGFILRYPKNGTKETGYAFEPWHIRYLGQRAEEVFESGLTLEKWYEQELKSARLSQPFSFRLTSLFS